MEVVGAHGDMALHRLITIASRNRRLWTGRGFAYAEALGVESG